MEYRRPFFLVWIISNARIAVVVVVGGGIKLCSVRFPVLAPTPPKTSCLQTWCNIVCYKHQLSINGRNKLIYHCHNLTGQSVYTVWLCPVEVNYQLPWFHCNFFKVCSNQVLMSKIVSSWELWHKIVLVSFGKIIYSGIISKILNIPKWSRWLCSSGFQDFYLVATLPTLSSRSILKNNNISHL